MAGTWETPLEERLGTMFTFISDPPVVLISVVVADIAWPPAEEGCTRLAGAGPQAKGTADDATPAAVVAGREPTIFPATVGGGCDATDGDAVAVGGRTEAEPFAVDGCRGRHETDDVDVDEDEGTSCNEADETPTPFPCGADRAPTTATPAAFLSLGDPNPG